MEKDKLPDWLKEQAAQFSLTPSSGAFDVMMRKREQQRKQRNRLAWISLSAAATLLLSVGFWFFPKHQEPIIVAKHKQQEHAGTKPENQLRKATQQPNTQRSFDVNQSRQAPMVQSNPDKPVLKNRLPKAESQLLLLQNQTPKPNIARSQDNDPVDVTTKPTPVIISATNRSIETDSNQTQPKMDQVLAKVLADSISTASVDTSAQTVALLPDAGKHSYWSVMGVFTPQLMNSVYNANSDATLSWMRKYLQNREQNDKAQYSFNAGVRIEKTINKHWSISTGIMYSMVKFEEIKLVNAVVIDTVFAENLAQTAKVSKVVEVTQNRFDISFSSLEVPLQAAYRLQRNKMFYQVNAGISYAYLFRTTSLVFDQTDSLNVKETNDAGNSRLNQHSLLLLAGINVGYEFSKRWSCYAGPVYRYSLNSIYSKDYIIRQQPYYLGIELGVKYSFR
jgi:hypothetical protein